MRSVRFVGFVLISTFESLSSSANLPCESTLASSPESGLRVLGVSRPTIAVGGPHSGSAASKLPAWTTNLKTNVNLDISQLA